MSAPFDPFVLTLDDLRKQMRDTFETVIAPRKGKDRSYTMVDAALSAFSVFFTQSPSFLEYQRSLEQTQGNNNARNLLGVHEIPSDNQIRNLLDHTPPSTLKPLYSLQNRLRERYAAEHTQAAVFRPFQGLGASWGSGFLPFGRRYVAGCLR